MKTISEIYNHYKIINNLREHMFRVAAVAFLISDNFSGELSKEDILTACLLHDMGNIIKFDFDSLPEEFYNPEGVEYWKKVQIGWKDKYGSEEHLATQKIAEEIGISQKALDCIDNIGFSKAAQNEASEIFEYKICNYADMRVTPYGVVSMDERIAEGHRRYKNRMHMIGPSENFELMVQSLKNIEKEIFENCKIQPEDITDEAVAPIISELRNFVIK